jgi:soluble lytic murein transglycosylase-like protein
MFTHKKMLEKIKLKIFILFLLNQTNLFAIENIFKKTGEYFNLNPKILYSIGFTESHLDKYAINKNTNGTFDIGIMQINTVHLPTLKKKFGIELEDLFEEKTNIFVGAWVLKGCFDKHGQNINTINCYNGRLKNNTYYSKVLKNYYIKAEAKSKELI